MEKLGYQRYPERLILLHVLMTTLTREDYYNITCEDFESNGGAGLLAKCMMQIMSFINNFSKINVPRKELLLSYSRENGRSGNLDKLRQDIG